MGRGDVPTILLLWTSVSAFPQVSPRVADLVWIVCRCFTTFMAYPNHNLLTIFGDLFDGDDSVEEWSINLRLCGSLTTAADPEENDALAAVISSWFTGSPMDTITHSGIRLVGFKHNAIGSNGRFETPEEPNTYTYTTPVAGYAGNTPNLPPQVALVVSLMTPKVGKSYRGRVYLPCGGGLVQNRFFVASSTPGTIAAAFADFIDGINTVTESANGTKVSIVSSKGFYTPVTGVRVGNVYDVQRRRAKGLYQTYSTTEAVS